MTRATQEINCNNLPFPFQFNCRANLWEENNGFQGLIRRDSLRKTYPSFNRIGSDTPHVSNSRAPSLVEIASRNFLTASTCFSVQNFLYNSTVNSSFACCCAERELTRLPSDWIVLEMSVSVRFVCWSCSEKKREQNQNWETKEEPQTSGLWIFFFSSKDELRTFACEGWRDG